jgi:pyruvate,water dikinase
MDALPQMAVIIQQLIQARASGVMMTLNPINGDRSKIMIEATWGLGALLVANQIIPDRFLIDKVTGQVIEQVIATKKIQQIPQRDKQQGTKIIKVPEDQQQVPTLSTNDITKLVNVGKEIEKHLGEAQDIEFSFQNNSLYLLQTRPETIWNRKPVKKFGLKRKPIEQIVAMMIGKSA